MIIVLKPDITKKQYAHVLEKSPPVDGKFKLLTKLKK